MGDETVPGETVPDETVTEEAVPEVTTPDRTVPDQTVPERIRILLVDDHPVVRDGLRGMCEPVEDFLVAGEAADGAEAVAVALRCEPDVVLMDLRMPGMGGVEAIAALRKAGSAARVVVLTTYDTDAEIAAALDAGAAGYLLKDAPRRELFAAIRAAMAGQTVLSSAVAGRGARTGRRQGAEPTARELTARELGVLTLVAQGRTNAQIARELFVSEATIKTHLGHLYAKLGATDRASAVALAYQRGILGG